jgi:hypothetical protein
MLEVNMRRPRYAFIILPPLVALASLAMSQVLERVRPPARALLLAVVALSLLPQAANAARWVVPDLAAGEPERIAAGRWLQKTYPEETRILADVRSYIPPRFSRSLFLFGVNQDYIDSFRPDLLILNHGTTGRWFWKKEGTRFADQQWEINDADGAAEVMAAHRNRLSGPSPWRTVYESPEVVILERSGYRNPRDQPLRR